MTACNSWNAHDDSISLQWNNAFFTGVATCFRQKHEVSRQAQGIDDISRHFNTIRRFVRVSCDFYRIYRSDQGSRCGTNFTHLHDLRQKLMVMNGDGM